MHFNKHSELKDLHAFLSPSKHHWVNYSEEKLATVFLTNQAAQEGSELHDLAAILIKKGIKQRATRQTFNMHVNDAIGYRMSAEVPLVYSANCFGTTDAISFRKERGHERMVLRVHDLKTGITPCSMRQLMIYAALFCLEYNVRPGEIDIMLRIYKEDDIQEYIPDVDEIAHIIDRIITFDRQIEELREESQRDR